MPLYDYECEHCGNRFELLRSIQENSIGPCPVCGGSAHKVFHPAGIIFKGSGWYINDSRKPDASDSSKSSDTTSKPPATEAKTESKKE